jgi:hypothetical protein
MPPWNDTANDAVTSSDGFAPAVAGARVATAASD